MSAASIPALATLICAGGGWTLMRRFLFVPLSRAGRLQVGRRALARGASLKVAAKAAGLTADTLDRLLWDDLCSRGTAS